MTPYLYNDHGSRTISVLPTRLVAFLRRREPRRDLAFVPGWALPGDPQALDSLRQIAATGEGIRQE